LWPDSPCGSFVLVVILGGTEALHYQHGLGVPGLGLAVLLFA